MATEEPVYTLAEAERILRPRFTRDRCMLGPGAPGHLIQEHVTRNAVGEIMMWSLGCQRCGAVFEATYPE